MNPIVRVAVAVASLTLAVANVATPNTTDGRKWSIVTPDGRKWS